MPPRLDAAGGAARDLLELVVDLGHLLDQRRLGVVARIGAEQAGGVGQEHEQVGPEQVRDQGRQTVVVPETDLVVGDGVVLVHDRDDAELQQAREGVPGVQVALPVGEVERGEQDLAGEQALGGQGVVVDAHEPRLADGRQCLQRPRVVTVPAARRHGGDARR